MRRLTWGERVLCWSAWVFTLCLGVTVSILFWRGTSWVIAMISE